VAPVLSSPTEDNGVLFATRDLIFSFLFACHSHSSFMAMLGYLSVPLGGGRVAPVNLLSEADFIARVDSHFAKDPLSKFFTCNEVNCGKQFNGSSRPRRVAHLLKKSIPVDGGGVPYNADPCPSLSSEIKQTRLHIEASLEEFKEGRRAKRKADEEDAAGAARAAAKKGPLATCLNKQVVRDSTRRS
jgi:hypothetical protein